METTAFHFHCDPELGKLLPLEAGDDAKKVQWIEADAKIESRYANLYASHRQWVDIAANRLKPHELARSDTDKPEDYPDRMQVPMEKVIWANPWKSCERWHPNPRCRCLHRPGAMTEWGQSHSLQITHPITPRPKTKSYFTPTLTQRSWRRRPLQRRV